MGKYTVYIEWYFNMLSIYDNKSIFEINEISNDKENECERATIKTDWQPLLSAILKCFVVLFFTCFKTVYL